ncbi:ANTH domain-domain-containing protein [Protomyces lactucae-debilis]|uniref:ANTH domain-domain-containing protein n=1 Tax=Protomyces lactucae-debilis TaxID=2754530 RepID=A0A1Y2ESR3_PROLT|nr:ANTH domain-containing protein [Protomyces lactucae-debilis]ORY74587.1 ANTH domain-domain-containing protein [Protomyces lactucae-debilis]
MYATNNQFRDGPSRNVDVGKQESELSTNIKKATSPEETAPKRKHVRACIVYTWDHQSSQTFWQGMKLQPILSDEVQTFKALIVVHKVIQEGAPVTLVEAQKQTGWLETCARSFSSTVKGYGPLIKAYVEYLTAKLLFHRYHSEFNGTFEYEEYVTLKSLHDPNEGYETIMELMNLQDQIDSFQKLIFAHFKGGSINECRISALVPLVHESYGIYKFITSMVRAMHHATSEDALEPLRTRYGAQHYRLLKFYYECSNLRYLTNLIAIPKLPQDAPNLSDNEEIPALPSRPKDPEPVDTHEEDEAQRRQAEYEAQQRRLQADQDAEMRRQQELAMQQQAEFERQQQLQQEQQRQAQENLQQQQYQMQTHGRLAELEQQLLAMQGQYNNDQLMLEQYDRRVKMLETELQQINQNTGMQSQAKDELIRSLQEQLAAWKQKYEALAKLYTQLRQEHMDLLAKYKNAQLKASSAQEAIDRKEKAERDLKAKNLDLADMIRERDRARLELDRLKHSGQDQVEAKERELREALDKINNMERTSGSELSSIVNRNNREIANLEELLRTKQRQLDDATQKLADKMREIENIIRDKDEELEIYKMGMDDTLLKMNAMQMNGDNDAMDEQIDQLILSQIDKLNEIIDAVLTSAAARVNNTVFELDDPMQAGNANTTPEYLLSVLENGAAAANEFATAINNFLADGPNADQAEMITATDAYASSVFSSLYNLKGALPLTGSEEMADQLVKEAKTLGTLASSFFLGVVSSKLPEDADQKTDAVINYNVDQQQQIIKVSKIVETLVPRNAFDIVAKANEDIGDLVDRELGGAARAIDAAAAKLQAIFSKQDFELSIHESLLEAAIAITNAIAELLKAATESQKEIVNQGRGNSSRTAFYKKNNRWTEGLISAAKAVANATNTLIESADGVISGTKSPEHMVVASNQVAAATAQLVAASRVKQAFMSKTQGRLEDASKRVNVACRAIVRLVQGMQTAKRTDQEDFEALGAHEFKVKEMEQQVLCLKLEQELATARLRLGAMRKTTYHQELDL